MNQLNNAFDPNADQSDALMSLFCYKDLYAAAEKVSPDLIPGMGWDSIEDLLEDLSVGFCLYE
jgi:hypothetical protein